MNLKVKKFTIILFSFLQTVFLGVGLKLFFNDEIAWSILLFILVLISFGIFLYCELGLETEEEKLWKSATSTLQIKADTELEGAKEELWTAKFSATQAEKKYHDMVGGEFDNSQTVIVDNATEEDIDPKKGKI